MTIDELAAAGRTTTRHVRSLQTLGLLPRPDVRARTGWYDRHHVQRLQAVLRLQREGFSLRSLAVLLDAHHRGRPLADVLGLTEETPPTAGSADLYDFDAVLPSRHRPVLSVVPTTMWDESEAS